MPCSIEAVVYKGSSNGCSNVRLYDMMEIGWRGSEHWCKTIDVVCLVLSCYLTWDVRNLALNCRVPIV